MCRAREATEHHFVLGRIDRALAHAQKYLDDGVVPDDLAEGADPVIAYLNLMRSPEVGVDAFLEEADGVEDEAE